MWKRDIILQLIQLIFSLQPVGSFLSIFHCFTSLSLILGIKIPLTAVGGLAYKFFHVFFVIFSVLFDNTLLYLFWGIFFEINYVNFYI